MEPNDRKVTWFTEVVSKTETIVGTMTTIANNLMETFKSVSWFCFYFIRNLGRPQHIRGLLGLKTAAWKVHWFSPDVAPLTFPPVDKALSKGEAAGLLAVGGKVTAESMLAGLRAGIFPYHLPHQPTKWWAPEPRMVIFPEELHIEKNVKRLIRNDRFRVTFDTAFSDVVKGCSAPRKRSPVSWIIPMAEVYNELHRRGHAYSIEIWSHENELVAGLFGMVSGRLVTIESGFTTKSNASKVGDAYLCAHLIHWGYRLADIQDASAHNKKTGGRTIPRDDYIAYVKEVIDMPAAPRPWKLEVRPGDDGMPIPIDEPTAPNNVEKVRPAQVA